MYRPACTAGYFFGCSLRNLKPLNLPPDQHWRGVTGGWATHTPTRSGLLGAAGTHTIWFQLLIGQAAQESALGDSKRFAQSVQTAQLSRVEKDFDALGARVGIQAHDVFQ